MGATLEDTDFIDFLMFISTILILPLSVVRTRVWLVVYAGR